MEDFLKDKEILKNLLADSMTAVPDNFEELLTQRIQAKRQKPELKYKTYMSWVYILTGIFALTVLFLLLHIYAPFISVQIPQTNSVVDLFSKLYYKILLSPYLLMPLLLIAGFGWLDMLFKKHLST